MVVVVWPVGWKNERGEEMPRTIVIYGAELVPTVVGVGRKANTIDTVQPSMGQLSISVTLDELTASIRERSGTLAAGEARTLQGLCRWLGSSCVVVQRS